MASRNGCHTKNKFNRWHAGTVDLASSPTRWLLCYRPIVQVGVLLSNTGGTVLARSNNVSVAWGYVRGRILA